MRTVALNGIALVVVVILSYGTCRLLSAGSPSTRLDVAPPSESLLEGTAAAAGSLTTHPQRTRAREASLPVAGREPSFLELKTRAEQLSPAELDVELAQLAVRIEQESWIERANADELSAEERAELAWLLRQKNALAVVRAHHQVVALAADDNL